MSASRPMSSSWGSPTKLNTESSTTYPRRGEVHSPEFVSNDGGFKTLQIAQVFLRHIYNRICSPYRTVAPYPEAHLRPDARWQQVFRIFRLEGKQVHCLDDRQGYGYQKQEDEGYHKQSDRRRYDSGMQPPLFGMYSLVTAIPNELSYACHRRRIVDKSSSRQTPLASPTDVTVSTTDSKHQESPPAKT